MNKFEFRQALKRNNLSCSQFAKLVGRTTETVYAFGNATGVPGYAKSYLRLLDERGGSHGLLKNK